LQDIPVRWKRILKTADLSQQIELALLLSEEDVRILGQECALTLINAPVYRETERYWLLCARAVITGKAMPIPPNPRAKVINDADDLKTYEQAIRSADCYLWLSQRAEFHSCAPHADNVRLHRAHWSSMVDAAFQRRIDTGRRCPSCGRPLPIKHRYKLCNRCYRSGMETRVFELWESK
jgi:hypothetical protein